MDLVRERRPPDLPDADPPLGAIEWGRWESQILSLCARMPNDCGTCGDPGPQSAAYGKTWYTDPPGRRITVRSKVSEGRRPESVPVPARRRMVVTHYAVWCPACAEMCVYRMRAGSAEGEFEELDQFYSAPTPGARRPKPGRKAKQPPQEEGLF